MSNLVLGVLILVLLWCIYRSTKKNIIVRYYRPSCPACASSQKEWDLFKRNVDDSVVVVEVNTEKDTAVNRKWNRYYKVNSVPTVIKVTKWLNRSVEYDGPRDSRSYMNFATYSTL